MVRCTVNSKILALSCMGLVLTDYSLQGSVTNVRGDSGSPQSGALTISGGSTGCSFVSTNSTVTLTMNNVSLPLTSSSAGQISTGGQPILHNYYNGSNIFIGAASGNFYLTGSNNTACGGAALNMLTNGAGNTAIGQSSLVNLTTGVGNIAIGTSVATGLADGNNNIFIGASAGASYTNGESNNIIIGQGNSGAGGDYNVMRLGLLNSLSACYIDGIYGMEPDPITAVPVYIDSSGRLGTIPPLSDVDEAELRDQNAHINELTEQVLKLEERVRTLEGALAKLLMVQE